jgi:hypothetical protein
MIWENAITIMQVGPESYLPVPWHTMQVKEWHYEKIGEEFELVYESYRLFHQAFVKNW